MNQIGWYYTYLSTYFLKQSQLWLVMLQSPVFCNGPDLSLTFYKPFYASLYKLFYKITANLLLVNLKSFRFY